MEVATVAIKNGNDYLIINEQDFNPDLHEKYEDSTQEVKTKRRKEAPPLIPVE